MGRVRYDKLNIEDKVLQEVACELQPRSKEGRVSPKEEKNVRRRFEDLNKAVAENLDVSYDIVVNVQKGKCLYALRYPSQFRLQGHTD